MIYKNQKQISGIYKAGKAITAVYYGARLVWQAISSCFGRGFWIGEQPWVGTDAWVEE